jgi:hypothetical protein
VLSCATLPGGKYAALQAVDLFAQRFPLHIERAEARIDSDQCGMAYFELGSFILNPTVGRMHDRWGAERYHSG